MISISGRTARVFLVNFSNHQQNQEHMVFWLKFIKFQLKGNNMKFINRNLYLKAHFSIFKWGWCAFIPNTIPEHSWLQLQPEFWCLFGAKQWFGKANWVPSIWISLPPLVQTTCTLLIVCCSLGNFSWLVQVERNTPGRSCTAVCHCSGLWLPPAIWTKALWVENNGSKKKVGS